MARKMEFDLAITKDMKSAASDSFSDSIKMIDVSEIAPSESNFYELSDIELLADDIEREGLKHNLVVYRSSETGLYNVISGHRRLSAIKLLISENRRSSTKIPCFVDSEKSSAESQFDLIMLNATQRKYSDADIMREYEEIERTLKALEVEGKPIKGRMRDKIAELLRVSPAQVGKIENIRNNAISEVDEAVKSGEMSISTANEIAKLAPEKQQEIIAEKPKITHKEVKDIQKSEKSEKIVDKKIGEEKNRDFVQKFDNDFDDDDSNDFEGDEDDEEISEPSVPKKKFEPEYVLTLTFEQLLALADCLEAYSSDYPNLDEVYNRVRELFAKRY